MNINWLHFWIRFWANFLIGANAALLPVVYGLDVFLALCIGLLVGLLVYRPLDILFPLYKDKK